MSGNARQIMSFETRIERGQSRSRRLAWAAFVDSVSGVDNKQSER